MDGRALEEIVEPSFRREVLRGAERRTTLATGDEKEEEEVVNRLKGMGYIS